MRNSVLFGLVRTALAGALTLSLPMAAQAVQIVTDCGFQCTQNCELNQNITCQSGDGIGIAAGVTLDLKGHNIICNDPNTSDHDCSATAVTMTGINGTVKDSGPGRGKIIGLFFNGVDCLLKSNSRVTGVWIEGTDGDGTKNCAQVDNNVLIAPDEESYGNTAAILSSGVASTDSIRDNFITGFTHAISVTGSKSVTIEHNVIVLDDLTASGIAVGFATSSGLKVSNNTVLGPSGGPVIGNAVATFTQNRCDLQNPNCATCISNGYCANPQVQVCFEEIVLKPAGPGSAAEFTFQVPSSPVMPALKHYLLVDDYPEVNSVGSGFFNITTGGAKTELYSVDGYGIAPGEDLHSCTITAHMEVDGPTTTPVQLVLKQNGVQSDGATITVDANYLKEYSRVMTTNPVTSLEWTTDDLLSGIQIGVKNNKDTTGFGVGFSDIVLECR